MVDTLPPIADAATALNSAPILPRLGMNTNVDKAAEDFEAMFATQLLQPMFDGISVDPTFGGGHGEEVMRSFLLQEYGKIIAKTGRLGIASQVKSEMLRAQETARARGTTSPSMAQSAYSNAQGGQHVSN